MTNMVMISGLLGLLFFSCNKEVINDKYLNDLIIKYGTTCGWCGGTDSLTISEKRLSYSYYRPCDDFDLNVNDVTDIAEWNEILKTFDLDDFLNIDINTCYVCVDGCDTWAYILDDTISHRISFGQEDSLEIINIKAFIDKLERIRMRYQGK